MSRIVFQEASQQVKIAARDDMADFGHQIGLPDQLLKRNVLELHLSFDRDHDTGQTLFGKCTVGTDTELAAEDHIDGQWTGTTGFVAQLQRSKFLFFARTLRVSS